KSYPEYDFGCVCRIYWERGCDLLVPWSRAHRESDGKFTTLGALEKDDLLRWCRWLEETKAPENKILLVGMSMGSTVSIRAASDASAPKNLCGVIADCGFISIRREICDILKVVGFPKFPIVWSGGIVSLIRLGISLDNFSTVEEIKNIRVPVLFIHGKADTFVLPDSSEKNFASCPTEKKLLAVDGAQHCFSFHIVEKLVSENILQFLDSVTAG
ncbi:MAG: alpha/beta hydrolase, partial [Clostridia bacterium]|nr:alpha/beta hydrolase [Clostridia bacterium]